uniref:Uncharacterized protein n=1 Tax=Pseudo-nitzschia multistriata TaxID=183589 RepID=A0A448ZER4_9STRA
MAGKQQQKQQKQHQQHSQQQQQQRDRCDPGGDPQPLLSQIRSNAIADLTITREAEEVFDANTEGVRYDDILPLLEALGSNESIRSVRFEGDFLDCLHPLSRRELLGAIGGTCLPSLTGIHLGDAPLFVADLCLLVARSGSLAGLELHDLVLKGGPEDFGALEEVLEHHPSLKEFEMTECLPSDPGIDLDRLRAAGEKRRKPPLPSFYGRSRPAKRSFSAVARTA